MFAKILFVYVLFINLIAFLLFLWDKRRAKLQLRRVSERSLLFCSALGGCVGAAFSMKWFRHKTQKISFLVFYMGTIILNTIYLILLIQYRSVFFA